MARARLAAAIRSDEGTDGMDGLAEGGFTVDSWEPEVLDDRPGAALARVTLTKTFRGGLAGTSTVHMISAADGAGQPAAYTAFERYTGELDGRKGSFVLQHCAPGSRGERLVITVVPGTGTEELTGITGGFEIRIDDAGVHTYAFRYALA
ncbi:DUF3224 domain-containing protein [Streptomyces sp. NRRL B-24484]|uniref:DUF3224 domain-containing protein n=1 Tax=Streptomyces sp. NRRL B-24484 TaxID=1463833 RepID=UPI000A8E2D72|nr:DUF3224 domain-containing protein [Streptomyces sp. NRRL B-24484]